MNYTQILRHTDPGMGTVIRKVVGVAFGLSIIVTLLAAVYVAGTPLVIYDKELELAERIAFITHNNKNDCEVMGDKLRSLVGNNAALIREARALTPGQREQGKNNYKARVHAARTMMSDGLIECHTNAKVRAATDKELLPGLE